MQRRWLLALLCWLVAGGIMIGGPAAADIPAATAMANVQQEAAQGGYRLITSDELWASYSKEPGSLLVIDTRQEWEYAAGHISGAVNFPMEPTWLARLTKRGELEQFLGPDKHKTLVFY